MLNRKQNLGGNERELKELARGVLIADYHRFCRLEVDCQLQAGGLL
jgi:hypothetical protein